MMDTYFYVQLVEGERVWAEYGPYLDFAQAAEISMEHSDILLQGIVTPPPEEYEARVLECFVNADGERETVTIKTREHKNFGDTSWRKI